MGHVRGGYGVYGKLQKRLDRFPIGAPPAEELFEVLKILFSEEEAFVASRMPLYFSGLRKLSRVTGLSVDTLRPLLDGMASKGLVIDFERNGRPVYILSPTFLGFFEFTFMRVRKDIPQEKVAKLLQDYAHENKEMIRGIFSGQTAPGRALIHEDALEDEERSTILTYDSASAIIGEARKIAVGTCYCRHVKEHTGDPCEYPSEVCTSLNRGADFVIRRGFMREVSKEEAIDIFARTSEAGLVFGADNVKKRPSFICHCCGCCCGMLGPLKKFQMESTIATSSFMAVINAKKCTGCGLCAKRCQIDVISVQDENGRKVAVVDEEMCIGCGVCHAACNFSALTMEQRGERVITPETAMEKYLMMAVEQGKLGNFLFDDFTSLPHAALRSAVNAFSHLEPVKNFLLKSEIRSKFIEKVLGS